MESENPSGAFDNRLTNAEFPDSFENCLEENHVKIESDPVNANDKCPSPRLLRSQKRTKGCGEETSNKCIVSTDEEEPQKPRQEKLVPTRKEKHIHNASKRIMALSNKHIQRKRAYAREYYRRKRIPIQEKRMLEEKSGRIEELAKIRQEIKALEEQRKLTTEPIEREKLRRKIGNRHQKEILLETAIDCNLEQLPRLHPKRAPLPLDQRERKSLYSLEYRLKMKEKKVDSALKKQTKVEESSDEKLQRKRAYEREKYKRRRKKVQEQRKLKEKSGRIEALAKIRQEIKALEEQLKNTDNRYDRIKISRKINIRNEKEKLLETAIDSNLEQLPPLDRKRLPLTPEQREHKRLYDIEYRLKRKQKKKE